MNFKKLFSAGLTVLVLTGCTKEGCTDQKAINYDPEAITDNGSCEFTCACCQPGCEEEINGVNYQVLTGEAQKDMVLTKDDNWLISGGFYIPHGTTLTIEPGTKIYAADNGTTPFLSVEQGGKIMACGTAEDPIVFTSIKEDPKAGDWGGIIINGNAPVHGEMTCEGHGGTGLYGGNDPTDNSGTLCYVRVEYAGMEIGTDYKMNGFSFQGCGSGTTLHHLQAYKSGDDGFEFIGGTVGLKYAVSTGSQDDSFDWSDGWIGKGQFWVAKQSKKGDRGIEADNNKNDNKKEPCSNPTLSNITLIGKTSGNDDKQGIKFREGTKGKIYNLILTGFPKSGCQVKDDQTLLHLSTGELLIRHSIIDNTKPFVYTNSDGEKLKPEIHFGLAENQNMVVSDGSITHFMDGYVGTTSYGAFDPAQLDDWFDAAPYIGAVPSTNDWTIGWTR